MNTKTIVIPEKCTDCYFLDDCPKGRWEFWCRLFNKYLGKEKPIKCPECQQQTKVEIVYETERT